MLKLFIALLASISFALPVSAQTSHPDSKCLICHGKKEFNKVDVDGRVRSLYVDTTAIRSSVHARWTCTDCHSSVTVIPHATGLPRVECTRCHFSGNAFGAPEGKMYDQYKASVHGIAAAEGKPGAPYCQDCHGTHGVRRHLDPVSPISRHNVASTCGRCHTREITDFELSVHGVEVRKGNPDSPVCTHCHGEHEIRQPTDPESMVNSTNIPNTCSACHASEVLMKQYGVRTVQVKTYEESYHGIAVKFGQKQAANCASCHGVHDILPDTDPRSRIHPENVPKTCGKCHQDANTNYARGRIHVDAEHEDAGIIYYIASFFKYLTLITLGVLIVNILLDLRRKLTSKKNRS
jgi:ribosomal protein S27AE